MKYILTEKTIELNGVTLFQLKATKSFKDVQINDLGGYIEKEENLNKYDMSWVYPSGRAYGDINIQGIISVLGEISGEIQFNKRSMGVFGTGSIVRGKMTFANRSTIVVKENAEIIGNDLFFRNSFTVNENIKIHIDKKTFTESVFTTDIVPIPSSGNSVETGTPFDSYIYMDQVVVGCLNYTDEVWEQRLTDNLELEHFTSQEEYDKCKATIRQNIINKNK